MKDETIAAGASIFMILFIAFAIWASVAAHNEGEDTCREMIAQAKTRTDSLIVFGMKPSSKFTTCADRLR